VDSRSDMFSFGAVLYNMPVDDRSFDSLIGVVSDEPAPPQLPATDIVNDAWRSNPRNFFQGRC
jgi:hypothetical protein